MIGLALSRRWSGLIFGMLLTALSTGTAQAAECNLLTAAEAAQVIGEGTVLLSAIENGACQYEHGDLTLNVVQPFSMSDDTIINQAYESMKGQGDTAATEPVSGVGDRAYVKKGNSGYSVMFVKRSTLAGVEVYGEGSDGPEMKDKLIRAAGQVAGRL